jgi:hypothetical protein
MACSWFWSNTQLGEKARHELHELHELHEELQPQKMFLNGDMVGAEHPEVKENGIMGTRWPPRLNPCGRPDLYDARFYSWVFGFVTLLSTTQPQAGSLT